MHKLGENQYKIDNRIIIGNWADQTYFNDSDVQVTFTYGACMNGYNAIYVAPYGHLRLGLPDDEALKTSYHGVAIRSETNATHYPITGDVDGSVELFSCYLSSSNYGFYQFQNHTRIWNTVFDSNVYPFIVSDGAVLEFSGVTVLTQEANSNVHFGGYGSPSYANKINLYGTGIGILSTNYGTSNYTLSNFYCRDLTYLFKGTNWNASAWFINFDSDGWTFNWEGTSYGEVYRQITFNLYVLNGALTDFVENANVTLTHDGTIFGSWLTNSTGQIDTNTITYGFYNQTGGNSMYGGTPWTLTITHPDWTTYTSVFYPYSKIEWSISMQDTSTADNNMVTIGLLLGGVAFLGIIVIRRKNN